MPDIDLALLEVHEGLKRASDEQMSIFDCDGGLSSDLFGRMSRVGLFEGVWGWWIGRDGFQWFRPVTLFESSDVPPAVRALTGSLMRASEGIGTSGFQVTLF